MTFIELSERLGLGPSAGAYPATEARRIWDAWVRSRAFGHKTLVLSADENRVNAFAQIVGMDIVPAHKLSERLRAVERELTGFPNN